MDKNQNNSLVRKDDEKVSLRDVPSMIIGPKRQEGETIEEYRSRREKEKKLMKVRLKYGISRHTKGQYKNPNRKIKKATRKIKINKR